MEVDRTTALCYFMRFLAGNPDGDAAARALVLGALAPVGGLAASIYAHDRESTLELVGNYGFDDNMMSGYRVVPVTMPMPMCEAFVSLNAVVVPAGELVSRYPILAAEPSLADGSALNDGKGSLAYVPVLNSGVPIGAISILQSEPVEWLPADWQYVDGVAAAVSMWLNNQREILVDRWRRTAPSPQREVRISRAAARDPRAHRPGPHQRRDRQEPGLLGADDQEGPAAPDEAAGDARPPRDGGSGPRDRPAAGAPRPRVAAPPAARRLATQPVSPA